MLLFFNTMSSNISNGKNKKNKSGRVARSYVPEDIITDGRIYKEILNKGSILDNAP